MSTNYGVIGVAVPDREAVEPGAFRAADHVVAVFVVVAEVAGVVTGEVAGEDGNVRLDVPLTESCLRAGESSVDFDCRQWCEALTPSVFIVRCAIVVRLVCAGRDPDLVAVISPFVQRHIEVFEGLCPRCSVAARRRPIDVPAGAHSRAWRK